MKTSCYLLALLFVVSSLSAQHSPPNLIDYYLNDGNTYTEIASMFDQLYGPTDLDFNSDTSKKDLWIINKVTEQLGGSTLTIKDLGGPNEHKDFRKDGNAWHFMSLPTGIAFGENGFFASSPGVFDANHNGGNPFTGPSLWSSDPAIYAQPSGGNGSHMDMLHEAPQCQGIAHEKGNAYWVFDGYNGDLVRFDFVNDHGAGNDYHSDGIVYRYSEESLKKDPDNKVVSHLTIQKSTGWLYAVDHGNQRVIRLDINSGEKGGSPSFGPFEVLAEYRNMVNYTWEEVVTSGLQEPAGIAVIDERMLVSDYATGEIIVYDISSMPAEEMGRIETQAEGIMGITIGPDGYLYYVDYDNNSAHQIQPAITGIANNDAAAAIEISPNPSNGEQLRIANAKAGAKIVIHDMAGKVVYSDIYQNNVLEPGIEQAGTYVVNIKQSDGSTQTKKWTVQ